MTKTYWFARAKPENKRSLILPVRWQGWLTLAGLLAVIAVVFVITGSMAPPWPIMGPALGAGLAAGLYFAIVMATVDPERSVGDYRKKTDP